jgi:hypothetical protein
LCEVFPFLFFQWVFRDWCLLVKIVFGKHWVRRRLLILCLTDFRGVYNSLRRRSRLADGM